MKLTERFEAACDSLGQRIQSAINTLWFYPALSAFLFAILSIRKEADPDLFARVAVGRLISLHSWVSQRDPFAYTPTKEIWVDHEWASGFVFYQLTQLGGDPALLLFKVFIALITLLILRKAQHLSDKPTSQSQLWLFICFLGIAFVWVNNVRSRIFTFLFFSILLLLFRRSEGSLKYSSFIFVPVLFAMWANFHAGFVLGLVFLLLYLGIEIAWNQKRPYSAFAIGALCVLATLVNPYGLDYWPYLIEAVTLNRGHIAEWNTLPFFSVFGLLYFGVCSTLGFGYFQKRDFKGSLLPIALIGFAAVVSIKHARLLPFFMMTSVAFGTDAFVAALHKLKREKLHLYLLFQRTLHLTVGCALLVSLTTSAYRIATISSYQLDYSHYPNTALHWLRTSCTQGNKVLVDFTNGSFALWRLYPDFLVSLDGRYEEVYPTSTLEDVFRAFHTEDPIHKEAFDRVKPDYILLPTRSHNMALRRKYGPSWQIAYQGPQYSVLADRETARCDTTAQLPPVTPIWQPQF